MTVGMLGASLAEFLDGHAPADVAEVIKRLATASIAVAGVIARGALHGALSETTGDMNADGDAQKALDVIADQHFAGALAGSGVAALVSEERGRAVPVDAGGRLLVALDPLDGSSNIDTNVSIGTIFSILPAPAGAADDAAFLQPGAAQRAAGFVVYGPQTVIVFTVGTGTHMATLDQSARLYRMTCIGAAIPDHAAEFAINASNYRHWHAPVRAYVDDCIDGADGPRGKNFNMRWIASMVADAFRILVRGGIYLYPADDREGYQRGRLRLLYEAFPVAFLVEQAGGMATDGTHRILDLVPQAIHDRVPLVFGSPDKVQRVRRYHLEGLGGTGESPLFGSRGLLRA